MPATMKFNAYLTHYYNCSRASPDYKFPLLPNKVYIALAIIGKEDVGQADADKFTKGTLHGHPDEILKKKAPIELEAVLELPEGQQSMKCVFVEGAPGVGKSTFAWELCRRKEEIKSMKNYSLVVLLRLREKRVQEIQRIAGLFCHDDCELQQAVAKEVLACDGKNVLFILDGFDELPTELRKDSFLVELIQGKHLPACTVLVTSRPSATADLLSVCEPQIHKRIEVLGFTKEHIKEYAKSMLGHHSAVLEDFLKYISINPAIHGMMYIPLNSAIVLEIYKANRATDKPIPRTLTQLYSELCLVLLRKYFVEANDPQTKQLPEKLMDFPETIKGQLLKLGELAFEGAKRQDIVFDQLPDGCRSLGFMNVSTGLYLGRNTVVSYSFLHLTLQEFLAAFYISSLPAEQQKHIICSFDSHALYQLGLVIRFVAGLTGFADIGWKLFHLSEQRLYVQCLFEAQSEQTVEVVCHTILCDHSFSWHMPAGQYDSDEEGRHRFWSELTTGITFRPWTILDYYAVGYCIAASHDAWDLLPFSKGDAAVEMLGYGLRSACPVHGSIRKLDLSLSHITHKAITHLGEFPPSILNQIKGLDLSSNEKLNKTAFDNLADLIPHLVNLTVLTLSHTLVGNGGMVILFDKLCSAHSLTKLEVCDTRFGLSDVQALSQLIRPGASLKKLEIGEQDMQHEDIILQMLKTVLSPSSLVKVRFWYYNWTPNHAQAFNLLEANNNLVSLKFRVCSGELNLVALIIAQALRMNTSLKVLGIPSCESWVVTPIGYDSVVALSEMLKVNCTLKKLLIETETITIDDIYILNSALQENSVITELHLHHRWRQSSELRSLDHRII